jgi:hypothetical protein
MSETQVARYLMNPAEDVILFGDELAEGMQVLPEDASMRHSSDDSLRAQRFMKVTRLRRLPGNGTMPDRIGFIGEWVDGYQEATSGSGIAISYAWIVKKDSIPGAADEQDPTP